MDWIKLAGRVLFLSEDPKAVHRQLLGEVLQPGAAEPLRDGVSVDEIAPSWVCYYFSERLGEFAYLALKCGDQYPLAEGAVSRGGFQVVVSGERHGARGPKEAALFAEYLAGIRLVIAKSFDPTYLQHCHALGILTSTDASLLEPLLREEPLPMTRFTQGQNALTGEIIRNGGLFGYTRARMAEEASLPLPEASAEPRPMTLGEKILARAAVWDLHTGEQGLASVAPGDGLLVRADWRYSHETATQLGSEMLRQYLCEGLKFHDPAHILAFRDHLSLMDRFQGQDGGQPGFTEVAKRLKLFQESFCALHGIGLHGQGPGGSAEGISHVLMAERYVLPGQVVVGTDPHACHNGALGALAFGVDAADIANAWVNGDVPLVVPPTCLIRLNRRLGPDVSAKDLVLHLLTLEALRQGRVTGHLLEFQGDALQGLRTDERATLTNMAPVFGALAAIIAPDRETERYLRERRGSDWVVEPWMRSDPGAQYARVVEVDCEAVRPMVAAPGSPSNALPIEELDREVRVDIAYVGSCTGGKRDDIERVHEVVKWALDRNLMLPLRVQLFIQLGSEEVRRYAEEKGWISAFEEVGARVLAPGCGACIKAGPGVSSRADQVTIGAFNRNYPGRSGPGLMWLASPATVVASAFSGRICSFEELRAIVEPVTGS